MAVDQYLTIDFPTPLAGDYNTDGVVDAADYTVWRNKLGSGVSLPNDNTPGVAADDYTRWKANFGAVSPGIGDGSGAASLNATVPEPSTALLAAFSLAAAVRRTRRKKVTPNI